MKHAEAILLLPDLVQGRLVLGQRREVQAHLSRCPECRELLGTYTDLGAALDDRPKTADPHVASAELVSFVLGPDDLDAADRLRVVSHLEVCSGCRADAQAVRRTEASLRSEAQPEEAGWFARLGAYFQTAWQPALAAAAIVVALAVYTAWIGLVRAPALRRDLDRALTQERALSDRVASLGAELGRLQSRPSELPEGLYAPTTLRAGLRGAGETPTVEPAEGDQLAELAVELAPEGLVATRGRHRIEVVRGDGTVVWSDVVEVARLRNLVRAADGVLHLRIAAEKLPPGRYEFRHSLSSGEVTESLSFEVVKSAR